MHWDAASSNTPGSLSCQDVTKPAKCFTAAGNYGGTTSWASTLRHPTGLGLQKQGQDGSPCPRVMSPFGKQCGLSFLQTRKMVAKAPSSFADLCKEQGCSEESRRPPRLKGPAGSTRNLWGVHRDSHELRGRVQLKGPFWPWLYGSCMCQVAGVCLHRLNSRLHIPRLAGRGLCKWQEIPGISGHNDFSWERCIGFRRRCGNPPCGGSLASPVSTVPGYGVGLCLAQGAVMLCAKQKGETREPPAP